VDEQTASTERGNGNRKPPATIYDIARLTGVSASTVSRALNKPGRINVRTERRIRDAAESLGYRINPMARALPTGRTGTLALLVSDITNPVYFALVRGAERVAAAADHTLVFAESQESAEIELATARRLQPAVDGVLLVASRLSDEQIIELSETKPLVLANRRVGGIPAVVPDVTPGIIEALDHLKQLGHRSIGYLAGPETSWMNRARWEALFEHAVDRRLSIVEITAAAPTVDGGLSALRRVMASGVTAVITFNDLMGFGLLRACREAGIPVPDRLSIIGFDDIFGSDLTTPGLTSIRSPLAAIGETAMRRLLAEIRNDVDADAEPALPTEFVLRQSTSAPAAVPATGA